MTCLVSPAEVAMDWGRGTEGHLRTEVVDPSLAVAAGPAGHARLDGHPVPLPHIGHPLPHTGDHTGGLDSHPGQTSW